MGRARGRRRCTRGAAAILAASAGLASLERTSPECSVRSLPPGRVLRWLSAPLAAVRQRQAPLKVSLQPAAAVEPRADETAELLPFGRRAAAVAGVAGVCLGSGLLGAVRQAVSGRRGRGEADADALSSLVDVFAGEAPASAEEPGGTVRLKQVIAESGLEDWKDVDYVAMKDDGERTSRFEAAIKKRLAGKEGQLTFVDVGTGSLACLAVIAARAGAKRVYAIEKVPEAAAKAVETVAKEGLQDVIQVISGDSMKVELPEKVDVVVSELIGSIATQEGLEPIIRDAKRFLKDEWLTSDGNIAKEAMIPSSCQTLIAPVKYTEHRIMDFASKRGIMSRGASEEGTLKTLRLRSKTKDVILLAKPQVMEDFDYCSGDKSRQLNRTLTFKVGEKKKDDAKDFSGFALWARVVVDDDDIIDVRANKYSSHWAYVVALMSELPTPMVAPGDIELKVDIDYAASPVRYALDATIPV